MNASTSIKWLFQWESIEQNTEIMKPISIFIHHPRSLLITNYPIFFSTLGISSIITSLRLPLSLVGYVIVSLKSIV